MKTIIMMKIVFICLIGLLMILIMLIVCNIIQIYYRPSLKLKNECFPVIKNVRKTFSNSYRYNSINNDDINNYVML